jgi:putative ABC transport system permease protein
MGAIARDLRFGLRLLLKNPGHTIAAVLALALGIGLSTAMFSIVYGAMFRGLPFEESERIMHVETANPSKDRPSLEVYLPDFLDWQRRQTSFEELVAYDEGTLNLSGAGGSGSGEKPERFEGAFVTSGLLRALRVRPLLGRGFLPGEDRPGAAPVALLSWGVWKARYGGDPKIVGRPVRINGAPGTIIGVMPQGFAFPEAQEVWTNLRVDPLRIERGQGQTYEVLGRLKPGVTLAKARAEMQAIAKSLAAEHPKTNQGLEARVKPLMEEFTEGPIRGLLLTMLGACLFVLLIACINVASLLMGRASRRTRELAIRSTLGAPRGRLVGQLLLESLLLSLVGAVPGVLLAGWGVRLFNDAIVVRTPPFWIRIALDPVALAFAFGMALLAALISGIMPALQASRPDVAEILKDEGRGSSSLRLGRMSRLVVVFEVALSCLLLVGAGLMVKSIVKLRTLDLGFDAKGVLTARIALFESVYPEEKDRVRFFDQLLTRVRAHPGAANAAAGTILPGNDGGLTRFAVAGRSYAREEDQPVTWFGSISDGWFETFRIPVRQGRDFNRLDTADSLPVAVVNESFARLAWPGEDPLGRQVRLSDLEGESKKWLTVVGVVADSQIGSSESGGEDFDRREGIYVPLSQVCPGFVSFAVRTRQGQPTAFTEALRGAIATLDPDLPIYWVYTMEEVLVRSRFFSDLFGSLFAIFGLSALVLASVGIYGVIAFSVQQRTQEIGIRMALGARRQTVLGLVLRQGMWQLIVGLVLGLLAAWPVSKLLASILVGVKPDDPATFALVSLVLSLVAFVACWIPARWASRTDPLVAIRYD